MSDPGVLAGGARGQLEERVLHECLDATRDGATVDPAIHLIDAPRGFGKSRILRRIGAQLITSRRRTAPFALPAAGTGPADLARLLPALIVEGADERLSEPSHPLATGVLASIDEALARRRTDPARLVDLAFSFPQALADDIDGHIVLLMDELGEVMRVTHHSHLQRTIEVLARRLVASRRCSIIATFSPASRAGLLASRIEAGARDAGRAVFSHHLPPLSPEDLPASIDRGARDSIIAVTGGRPSHVERLVRRVLRGSSLRDALLIEMTPPDGLLWHECRFDYHFLVERCRGDASVRSVLGYLARNDAATRLSDIARHLRIRPPTAVDYLSWMNEVGLIRRQGLEYRFADPLLRLWVLMSGPPAMTAAQSAHLMDSALEGSLPSPAASPPESPGLPGPRALTVEPSRPAPPATPVDNPSETTDLLMEID